MSKKQRIVTLLIGVLIGAGLCFVHRSEPANDHRALKVGPATTADSSDVLAHLCTGISAKVFDDADTQTQMYGAPFVVRTSPEDECASAEVRATYPGSAVANILIGVWVVYAVQAVVTKTRKGRNVR